MPTKLPEIDGEKSVHDWNEFCKRAEPTRAICKKVREDLDSKRQQSVARAPETKVEVKPPAKAKRKRKK
jgi:hypothetical protein